MMETLIAQKIITINKVEYKVIDIFPKCCEYHQFGSVTLLDMKAGKMYQAMLDRSDAVVPESLTDISECLMLEKPKVV